MSRLLPAAIALLLTGCTPETTTLHRSDPADPSARTPPVGYRSTIAPFTSLRPAEPAPWRARNDAATPAASPNE